MLTCVRRLSILPMARRNYSSLATLHSEFEPQQLSSWWDSKAPLVDLREAPQYFEKHVVGSTNIPWTQLAERWWELPPRLNLPRVEMIAEEYQLRYFFKESDFFWETAKNLNLLRENSAESERIWQPSPCLAGSIEEIEKIRRKSGLPPTGICVDLACGSARDGLFLSQRGWRTINVDQHQAHLDLVKKSAEFHQLSESMEVLRLNLEKEYHELQDLPKVDLVNISRFLYRPIFPYIKEMLAPGGFLVYHTFMESSPKPTRSRYKLKHGELASYFRPPEFEIISDSVHVISDGRDTSWFVVQKVVE